MTKLRGVGQRISTVAGPRLRLPPKRAEAQYQTADHQAWRAEVLRRAGGCCQTCGRAGVRLFADHVVELRDGGAATDPDNGQALCGSCHTRKTTKERARRMGL